MFRPARMTRLLVSGHRQHQAGVIEVLHQEKAVHIEDYLDPTGTTRIGEPLPEGQEVSDLLLRVRGLVKSLGSSGVPASMPVERPAALLAEAEAAVAPALARAAEARTRLQALEAEQAQLAPLSGLDVDLAVVGSLRSVRGFLGTAARDPRPLLSGTPHEAAVAPTERGVAVALFVAAADSAAAERALSESGFQSVEAPAGRSGTPARRLAELGAERAAAERDAAAVESELAALRTAWGGRLAALDAHLAAASEKTQAPLRFGHTASTFHVEGWVPVRRVNRVKNALAARFHDALVVAELGDAPRGAEAHGHASGHDANGAHAEGHEGGHAADDPKEEPPIHLENPRVAHPYQYLLGLLGKPRYSELDPTKLMLVFFPLFFGLMVGDLLVGLIIMAAGFYFKTHKVFGIGGPAIGKALIAGGFMAALVGGVVFGEALGIHFVTPEPHEADAEKEISWEEVLGLHIPSEGFLHKTGGGHEAAAAGEVTTLASEVEEKKGILAPHSDVHLSVNGWFNLGYYSKVHDIKALLLWSVIIGFVHLVLGLVLGVRNVYVRHGAKLAIQEKAAWLGFIAGLGVLVWGVTGHNQVGLAAGGGVALASVALLCMGAAHTVGVWWIALLELPSLFGNLLSYTRLAAIGASKAGMAIAFTAIGFDLLGGGDHHSVVGWIVYVLGFAGIIVLSILAGTLQSLRLQFVEFFSKFYQGGGRPYVPFGRRAP